MEATKQAGPSPELIFTTMQSYQRSAALKGAVELDVFTGIGEGATTAKALAARSQATERGMRILCDYLVINGLLTKSGMHYGLTPDSALFLDRRSPACMGGMVTFLLSPVVTDWLHDVAKMVRKGGTLQDGQGTVEHENPMWIDFARSMVPLMAPAAEEIAALIGADQGSKWKVLDIAAGLGIFGVTIAKHNPKAEIVAVDWAGVLSVAQENAQAAGVAARFRQLPGSAFDVDYGGGYDIALVTNFLHHFDPPTCEGLLRKVHRALNPGGRAVTLEFVPNEDRVTPPLAASFSMQMLAGTPSGDAYTFAGFDGMLRRAGFAGSEIHQLKRSPEQVIISRK